LFNLRRLIQTKLIPEKNAIPCLRRLAKEQLVGDYDLEYKALLADTIIKFSPRNEEAVSMVIRFAGQLTEVEAAFGGWEYLAPVLGYCVKSGEMKPEVALLLMQKLELDSLDYDDINALVDFRRHLDVVHSEALAHILRPVICNYWEDNIEEELRDRGTLASYMSEDDADEAEEAAERELEKILGSYNIKFSSSDFQDILSRIDVDDFIYQNQKSEVQLERGYGGGTHVETGGSEIDDLFSVDFPPRS
jgi:hypothetical protein